MDNTARYDVVLHWLNRIGVKASAAPTVIHEDGLYRWHVHFSHPEVETLLIVHNLEMYDWRESRAVYEALQWLTDAGNEIDYPNYETWVGAYGEVATQEWWEMITAAREFFGAVPGASAEDLGYVADLESGDSQSIQEALLFLQGVECEVVK